MEREKLTKLVDLFEELIKQGNPWLAAEMMNRIQGSTPIEDLISHPLMKDIYEQCIENNIKKQAKEFYKDFYIEEIKPQLIKDFIKMEHERRQNDFNNFGLALFQQLENIINYVQKNIISPVWEEYKYLLARDYKKNGNEIKTTIEDFVLNLEYEDDKKKIEGIKTYYEKTEKWTLKQKFRSIVYFIYLKKLNNPNKNITYPENDIYKKVKKTFSKIYQIRNNNHRDYQKSDIQQSEEIKGQEGKYFLKFYGFLEDFVDKIDRNLREIDKQEKNSGITLGDINPELASLKKQLEDQEPEN